MNLNKITLLVAAIVMLATPPSQASLRDSLEEMLFMNATGPRVYETRRRGGVSFGSAYLRTPVKSINLVQMSPVRFNAGCSGISLHFGGFSFINTEEFEAVLRAIGQNALGYLLQISLEQMCPTCANTINRLADRINRVASNFRNTCQVAKMLVDESGLGESVQSFAQQVGQVFSLQDGDCTDANDCDRQEAADPGSTAARNADKIPVVGNHSWRALAHNGAGNALPIFGDSEEGRRQLQQYIMSILGTLIYNPNADRAPGQGNDPSTTPDPKIIEPTLTLGDLYDPRENATYWQCTSAEGDYGATYSEWGCLNVVSTPFTFEGVLKITRERVVGEFDSPSNESLWGALVLGQEPSEGLTNFLQATGIDLMSMQRIRGNPEAMYSVAEQMIEPIAARITAVIGESIYRTAVGAFHDVPVEQPEVFKRNLAALQRDVYHYKVLAGNDIRNNLEFYEFIRAVQRDLDRDRSQPRNRATTP